MRTPGLCPGVFVCGEGCPSSRRRDLLPASGEGEFWAGFLQIGPMREECNGPTCLFSPLAGRRCRQADEGPSPYRPARNFSFSRAMSAALQSVTSVTAIHGSI